MCMCVCVCVCVCVNVYICFCVRVVCVQLCERRVWEMEEENFDVTSFKNKGIMQLYALVLFYKLLSITIIWQRHLFYTCDSFKSSSVSCWSSASVRCWFRHYDFYLIFSNELCFNDSFTGAALESCTEDSMSWSCQKHFKKFCQRIPYFFS